MRSLFVLLLAVAAAGCETRESEFDIVCGAVADLGYFTELSQCTSSACNIKDLEYLQAYDTCLDDGGDATACEPELERLNPLCRQDTSLAD